MIRRRVILTAALLAILLCIVCFAACQAPQPPVETSMQTSQTSEETSTAIEATTAQPIKAVPPIDIEDVPFVLADMDCYLEFDIDGLAVPALAALFREEKLEYEENIRIDWLDTFPFSLETAEYDMNDDGAMDYVVKWYHYDINIGNAGTGGFFEVVYRSNGKLKRLPTDKEIAISHFRPVVLHTKTNGFHDIANSLGSTYYKPVWKYNGTDYIEEEHAIEKEVDIWRVLGGDDLRLEGDKIYLTYNFDLTRNTQDHPPLFIAGLFKTAQRDGIVTQERLWCCDENGDPKLFVDQAWNGAFFCDEYGGGELPDGNWPNLVCPDELEVILYEP